MYVLGQIKDRVTVITNGKNGGDAGKTIDTNGRITIGYPPFKFPPFLPTTRPPKPVDNDLPLQDLDDGIDVVEEVDELPTDLEDQYTNGETQEEDFNQYPEVVEETVLPEDVGSAEGDVYITTGEGEVPPVTEVIDEVFEEEKKFPWMYVALGAGALALFVLIRKKGE